LLKCDLNEYNKEKIGKNKKVTAPTYTWKIIVILDQPGQGLGGITENTKIIAVDIPNTNKLSSDWQNYLVSIDQLEAKTGYDFLDLVPESIQAVIEAKFNN